MSGMHRLGCLLDPVGLLGCKWPTPGSAGGSTGWLFDGSAHGQQKGFLCCNDDLWDFCFPSTGRRLVVTAAVLVGSCVRLGGCPLHVSISNNKVRHWLCIPPLSGCTQFRNEKVEIQTNNSLNRQEVAAAIKTEPGRDVGCKRPESAAAVGAYKWRRKWRSQSCCWGGGDGSQFFTGIT